MKALRFIAVASLAATLSLAFLAGCNLLPGGGTDVGNPEVNSKVTGSLMRLDGTPAPWIHIQLRPKAFLANPDSATTLSGETIQDEFTDTQGFFTFESVPRGEYRIQAMDSNAHGAVMELSTDGHTAKMNLAPVYLDTTGSISGIVAYKGPPMSFRPKILVAIYGMDQWTLANNAGEFTLSDLPPGKYRLHITTAVDSTLSATVPETVLIAGGKVVLDTVDLGP